MVAGRFWWCPTVRAGHRTRSSGAIGWRRRPPAPADQEFVASHKSAWPTCSFSLSAGREIGGPGTGRPGRGPPRRGTRAATSRCRSEADGGPALELVHEAHVHPDLWVQFGPEAVGVGWPRPVRQPRFNRATPQSPSARGLRTPPSRRPCARELPGSRGGLGSARSLASGMVRAPAVKTRDSPGSARNGGDAVVAGETGDQTDQESRSAGRRVATSVTAMDITIGSCDQKGDQP
jgi:hypothetical protein